MGGSGSVSVLKEVGIKAFAVLARSSRLEGSGDHSAKLRLLTAPLRTMAAQLAGLPPAAMFDDWATPRAPPSQEVAPSSVFAVNTKRGTTDRDREAYAPAAATTDGTGYWMTERTRSAHWGANLGASRLVTRVSVEFRPSCLPETAELEVTTSDRSSIGWGAVAKVTGKDVKVVTVFTLKEPTPAHQIRVTLNGYAVAPHPFPNSDSAFGIVRVRITAAVPREEYSTASDALTQLGTWLRTVTLAAAAASARAPADAGLAATYDYALRALMGLARATGSTAILAAGALV